MKARRHVLLQVVLNSFYVTLWISLSGTVILYNKWILAYYGFPYPISLTMWHMAFSSVLAFLCVRLGYVPAVNMTMGTYMKAILPIGALFAGKGAATSFSASSNGAYVPQDAPKLWDGCL